MAALNAARRCAERRPCAVKAVAWHPKGLTLRSPGASSLSARKPGVSGLRHLMVAGIFSRIVWNDCAWLFELNRAATSNPAQFASVIPCESRNVEFANTGLFRRFDSRTADGYFRMTSDNIFIDPDFAKHRCRLRPATTRLRPTKCRGAHCLKDCMRPCRRSRAGRLPQAERR